MCFTPLRLAILFAVLLGTCAAAPECKITHAQKELPKFQTPNGQLLASLVLQDGQGGFAGVSGEIWTIAPDGHLSIAHFLNTRTDKPYWERDLTPGELKNLAEVLAASKFLELPNAIGDEPKVNPHSVTLIFGNKKAVLSLPPGEPIVDGTTPPAGDPQAVARHNFISVVRAIHALAADRKAAH